MKWYTCCPVAFTGCESFFQRDSGAFCLAFQQLGIESKTILPLPVRDENGNPNLIRTEYKNLESSEWWKSLGIDGLVLYAWGMGKYTPIVKAAREAGIFIVTFMDTSNISYPWKYWHTLTTHLIQSELIRNGKLKGGLRAVARIIKAHTVSLFHYGRKKHFDYAHIITFPSPQALQSLYDLKFLYGEKNVKKSILLANPIPQNSTYTKPPIKRNNIICIGRWDDEFQKNPDLLIKTLELFIKQKPTWTIEIYGKTTPKLEKWHRNLPNKIKNQVTLKGLVPNTDVKEALSYSKISLCTSRYEGSHVASAEALCAGCSIVGPHKTPHLNCLQWYSSHNSGLLSPKDTSESLAQTLIEETQNWEKGDRNPEEISAYWQEQLLAVNSCKKILTLYSNYKKSAS